MCCSTRTRKKRRTRRTRFSWAVDSAPERSARRTLADGGGGRRGFYRVGVRSVQPILRAAHHGVVSTPRFQQNRDCGFEFYGGFRRFSSVLQRGGVNGVRLLPRRGGLRGGSGRRF